MVSDLRATAPRIITLEATSTWDSFVAGLPWLVTAVLAVSLAGELEPALSAFVLKVFSGFCAIAGFLRTLYCAELRVDAFNRRWR